MKFIILFLIVFNCEAKTFVIKNHKKYLNKQNGKYWCWAASLESLYRFKNEKVTQFDIIKGYVKLSDEDIHLNKNDLSFGIKPLTFYQKYLNNLKEIKRSAIKKTLHLNKPIMYLSDSHVSLIVGYDMDHFITMDTATGSFKRIKFHHIMFLGETYDQGTDKSEPAWFYSI